MTFKQETTYEEYGHGTVQIQFVLADNFSNLTASNPAPISCLNIKTLRTALANNDTVENSIVSFEITEQNVRQENNVQALEICKNQGFLRIIIDDTIIYTGKISGEFEAEDYLWDGQIFRKWNFSTLPLSTALLKEVKLKDLLSLFTTNDWQDLIVHGNDNYYPCYLNYARGETRYSNLISLNFLLYKLVILFQSWVYQNYNQTITVSIPLYTIPNVWFLGSIPVPDGWSVGTLCTGDTAFEAGLTKQIRIGASNSVDYDGFFIDAGFFYADSAMALFYRLNNKYTDAKDLKSFSDKIIDKTFEEFLQSIAQNFALSYYTIQEAEYQYTIHFTSQADTPTYQIKPTLVQKAKPKFEKLQDAKETVIYVNHFFYVETDSTLEDRLGIITHYNDINEFKTKPIRSPYRKQKTSSQDQKELLWGFYPYTYLKENVYGVQRYLLINARGFKGSIPFDDFEQNTIFFTRELYIWLDSRPTSVPRKDNFVSAGLYKVGGLVTTQNGQLIGFVELSTYVNYVRSTIYTSKQTYEIECGGLYANDLHKIEAFNVNNSFVIEDQTYRIIQVERDFQNIKTKVTGVHYA